MKYFLIYLIFLGLPFQQSLAENKNMIYCFSSYNLVEVSPGKFKRYHSNIWAELCPDTSSLPLSLLEDSTTFESSDHHEDNNNSGETFLIEEHSKSKVAGNTITKDKRGTITVLRIDPIEDFLQEMAYRDYRHHLLGIEIKKGRTYAYSSTTRMAMEMMPNDFPNINSEVIDDILQVAEKQFNRTLPSAFHRKEMKSDAHRALQVNSYLNELQELLYRESLGVRTQYLQDVINDIEYNADGFEAIGNYLEEADKKAKAISPVTTVKDPCDDSGQQEIFKNKEHDQRQLVESLSDNKGNKIEFDHNDHSLIDRIVLPSGQELKIDYDQTGMPHKFILPNGGELKIKRNDERQVVGIINPRGFSSEFGYTDGVLSSRTDALGNTLSWDGQKLIDPLKNETLFKTEEDSLKIVWPDHNEVIFYFNEFDQSIKKLVQEDKSVIHYSYPKLNKNTVNIKTKDDFTTLIIDEKKHLIHAENKHITFKRIYKHNTLLQADYFTPKKENISYGVEYNYDDQGKLSSYYYFGQETFRIPPNISYRRDADGIVVGVTLVADDVHFEWKKVSDNGFYTKKEIFSTGLRVFYSRNKNGDLERIANLHSSDKDNPISVFEYDYDLNSNITSLAHSTDGLKKEFDFVYDELDRVVYSGLDGESFTYDALGNAIEEDYVIDHRGRLLSTPKKQISYDLKGNMTSISDVRTGKTTNFYWTVANRLKKATIYQDNKKVETLEFSYDAVGRRVEKIRTHALRPELNYVRRYVYQNGNLFAELDGEYNKVAIYVHGPGVDNPLAMIRDINQNGKFDREEVFTYTKDHLGSIREVLDFQGRVVQRYSYTAYGETTISGKSLETPYAYTGRIYDQETNLYFNRARYYYPKLKMFISPDPIGFAGGDSNLYRYVFNNPVRFRDPSGTIVVHPGVVIGGIFGGLAGGASGYMQKGDFRQAVPHAMAGVVVGSLMGSGVGFFLGVKNSSLTFFGVNAGANIFGQMFSSDQGLFNISIPSPLISGVAGAASGALGALHGVGRSYILSVGADFLPASVDLLAAGVGKPDC